MKFFRNALFGMMLTSIASCVWAQAPGGKSEPTHSETIDTFESLAVDRQKEERELPPSHVRLSRVGEGGCSAIYQPEKLKGMQRKALDGKPILWVAPATKDVSNEK